MLIWMCLQVCKCGWINLTLTWMCFNYTYLCGCNNYGYVSVNVDMSVCLSGSVCQHGLCACVNMDVYVNVNV